MGGEFKRIFWCIVARNSSDDGSLLSRRRMTNATGAKAEHWRRNVIDNREVNQDSAHRRWQQSAYEYAATTTNRSIARGLFMSLVTHYWIGDVQVSRSVSILLHVIFF